MAEKMAAEGECNKTGFKQCILVIEKKVRNLEKRKGKLDSYRDMAKRGEEMNKDQLDAISKYDVVLQNLEFARDMQKQFVSMNLEADKLQKKLVKKERAEKQQQECCKLREVLLLQNVLNSLGEDNSTREDLLSGKIPSLIVSKDNLTMLDDFYQLIVPARDAEENFEDQLLSASEHLQCYLESSDKKVTSTASYKEIRDLVERIHASGYLSNQSNNTNTSTTEHVLPATTSSQPALENGSEENGHADSSVENELAASCESSVSSTPAAPSPAAAVRVAGFSSGEDHGVGAAELSYPHHQQQQRWASSSQHIQSAAAVVGGAVQSGRPGDIHSSSTSLSGIPTPQGQQQLEQQQTTAADIRYGSFLIDNTSAAAGVAYGAQRPINEIVSSMQGASFNFLQESQIELDSMLDPAIVAVMPVNQMQNSLGASASSVAPVPTAAYTHSHATAAQLPTSVPHSLDPQQQHQSLQQQQHVSSAVHSSSLFTAAEDGDIYQRHQQLLQQQQLAHLNQQVFPGKQQDGRYSVEHSFTAQELRDPAAAVHQQQQQIGQYGGRYIEQSQSFPTSQQISSVAAGKQLNPTVNSAAANSSSAAVSAASYNNITPASSNRIDLTLQQQQQKYIDQSSTATQMPGSVFGGSISHQPASALALSTAAGATQHLQNEQVTSTKNSNQTASHFIPSSADVGGGHFRGGAGGGTFVESGGDYYAGGDSSTRSGSAGLGTGRAGAGHPRDNSQYGVPPPTRGGGAVNSGGKMAAVGVTAQPPQGAAGAQYNGSRGGYNRGGGSRGGPGGYYGGAVNTAQRGGGAPSRGGMGGGGAPGIQRGPGAGRPQMMQQHNA